MKDVEQLPLYKSHKRVHALEIASVGPREMASDRQGLFRHLRFKDEGFDGYAASEEMFSRYVPVPGDFLVFYEDGYKSFSPRKAFLEGYTRAEPDALEFGAAARQADVAHY